uniref:Catalase-peroxidase n=1 Tax=Amphora coffeiformis TaxID=265554 RepID=A0A7S3KVA9_9STRA
MSMNKCPFASQNQCAANEVDYFFPERLNLRPLQQKGKNNPEPEFGYEAYKEEFAKLDLKAVKKDIKKVLTTSQEWWPADWGNYAPFFIRQAWHQAGTYRIADGRGGTNTGNQRFAPLNSWPDNGNLDKARRLLWPIKQKYGRKLSWGDLFMLTGNRALEIMDFKPFGFGGGRVDIYGTEEDIYWGPETDVLTDERHEAVGQIQNPLGASEMGLIYVNPEGPGGNPDPLEAAKEIRTTFGNMAMNDEETVALIAGGHTFGKSHGAAPDSELGPPPEGASIEKQGLGYHCKHGTGKGKDTVTSGLEGAWTGNPLKWTTEYFDNLYKYEWKCITGPGGKTQWTPTDESAKFVPDAHIKGLKHKPMMFTTDLALIKDPAYAKISKRFHENHEEFKEAFAKAWYKLTHRDMGPVKRLLGSEVAPEQIWQDPIPKADYKMIDEDDVSSLKSRILGTHTLTSKIFGRKGLNISTLVRTAWASAATFRCTDFRGGANGARIRLNPQCNWEANDPEELKEVLEYYETIKIDFDNSNKEGKKISMADLIVLGGCAAIEQAAQKARTKVKVPFTPGRTDATDTATDVASFAPLEPIYDGFRNYQKTGKKGEEGCGCGCCGGNCSCGDGSRCRCFGKAEEQLVNRAHLLGLNAAEMTVLVGGLRVLGANHSSNRQQGVLTKKPETLTNDFFVNLLDVNVEWKPLDSCHTTFESVDRNSSNSKSLWSASRVDLIFGHHSELRAIAEYYACDDAKEMFVQDFVQAWVKVMENDLLKQ